MNIFDRNEQQGDPKFERRLKYNSWLCGPKLNSWILLFFSMGHTAAHSDLRHSLCWEVGTGKWEATVLH